jgi:hypothetical protein
MLGWCLSYLCASFALGAFLAALGYRHRVWSRADLHRETLFLMRSVLH